MKKNQCVTRAFAAGVLVASCAGLASSASADSYWRFEEAGGTTVLDSGSDGLNGTLNARPVRDPNVPTDPVPQSGLTNMQSLDLGWLSTSAGGHVTVPDTGGLLSFGNTSFTIEAWVQLDSISDTSSADERQWLCMKKPLPSSGDQLDYGLLVQAGNLGSTGRELVFNYGTGNSTGRVVSSLEIDDLSWHHVSFAYDAAAVQFRFGVDDVFEVVSLSKPNHTNSGPLRIGGHQNASGTGNQFLRGAIDEVRVSGAFLPVDQLLNAPARDCQPNGIPDVIDTGTGTSLDIDDNGVPDECEDCNGNGIPDHCDIACDGPCGGVTGCGASDDCDGNGVPDECDLAAGTLADCQPDGIADACQLTQSFELFYDQGWARIAWRADEPHMAWLNRFNVADGAGVVHAIEVLWGIMPLGTQVEAYVWSDPDGDGDPTDARVLWSDTVTVLRTDAFSTIDVPDIDVGDTGASFFVGFIVSAVDPDFPAALDIDGVPIPDRSWGIGSNAPIDPNDLSAGAVEYGTINDLLFGNVWLIRAQMRGPGTDCNGNGIPDECEIGVGTSDDADGNGVPDECEDCDNNGVLDAFDIAGGASLDCNADGVPDACQVLANDCDGDGVPDDCQLGGSDCNNNGILDACDIASGYDTDADGSGVPDECEDCNGNSVLDSIDLATLVSNDCNSDGVPDECQFGAPLNVVRYAYDDGVQESNLCFVGGSGLEYAWMNHFTVQPDGEWVSAIEVVWGDTYPDLLAEVVLWTDPDGDGDPADAQVIITVDTRSMKIDSPLDNLNVVPIPPTYVGPAGTSFFVGVHFDDVWASGCFIALDVDEPHSGEGWYALAPSGTLDLNDLAAYNYAAWPNHDLLVRAVGFDGLLEQDCNVNQLPDECDIGSGGSNDVNGNGAPDECECSGDVTGDGQVDITDLAILLSQFGSAGPDADINGDGVVNLTDLGIVLGDFGCSL